MKLSVVIVNYNVKYYLEQCLRSLQRSLKGVEAEVFVVTLWTIFGIKEDFHPVSKGKEVSTKQLFQQIPQK